MSTTDQMLADSRKKSMLQYVSEGASVADLDAAGYTLDEISILPNVNTKALAASKEYNRDRQGVTSQSPKPINTSQEFDRDRQGGAAQYAKEQGTIEAYTPTTRDNWREGIRQGISALGVDDQTAQFYAGRIAGTGGDLGLVDVTGLGVIPGVQEGVQQAERGYKTGSKTDMAMGALGTGLNVLAAIPGGKLVAKGITKGVEKLAEKAIAASDNALVKSLDVPIDKTVEALKPSYKPTMFRTSDAGKIEVNPNSLMEFYSPTVETIRNVEFPAKGYKGSELLKFLREKAPGVRKTEVDALDLKLDPQKRYTREEALAEVEKKAYKVYAEEVDDTVYKTSQRQDISDPEISFSTIKINATREGDTFMPSLGYTHYDPETIAHTRNSIRENAEGKRYLLVEEIQSDLVQASGAKPRGALTRDEAYEEAISQSVKSLGKDPKKLILYKKDQKFYDSVLRTSSEDARIQALKQKGIEVPKEDLDNLEELFKETRILSREHNYDSELYAAFDDLGYRESRNIDRRMKAITKAPLTDDADAVRLALQSAMAKADESDATSIVIPNLQRIVTAQGRGARYGTENYDKYMKAGSGFQKTYVDGVGSFVAQLKKEYGDAIKVEQIELPYRSKTTFYSDAMSGRDVPLDNTALRIDFSGLKGVNLKSGQFAEGGLTVHGSKSGGQETRDIFGDATFSGDKGSITPSFSYSKTKGSEEYPDGIVVDTEGKHLGLALNGELFLDKEGQNKLRAGIARDTQSGSQEVSRLGELLDKGSYADGSTRFSLGADLGKLSLDMVTDKDNTSGKAVYRLGKNAEVSAEGSKGSEPRFGFNFSKSFSEGGSVEDEQMNRLMQEGGIAGSDVTQEPVTGNEVPPGAMPSEVRDDISAQLSEGEYVVPADVVRFFGVKYFEDLRSQAKQGLSEMQSNGRIGGATVDGNGIPAEEEDDDQLTPEEEQMLQNALGSSDETSGMAVGGDVVPFDRTTFTLDGGTSDIETRKYIDPTTGITQDFQFVLGEPSAPIPSNFVPWTQAIADTAGQPKAPTVPTNTAPEPKKESWADTHPTAPPGTQGAVAGEGGGFNYDKWAEKNYANITTNPYQFGVDALTDTTGKTASKVVGGAGLMSGNLPVAAVGMGIKAYNKIENIAGANASLKIMEAQGLQGSTEYSNLKKLTDAAINDLPGLQKAAVKNGLLATGNQYAEPVIRQLQGGVVTPTAPVASAKDKAERTPTNIVSSGNAELDRRIAAGDPKAIANQQAAARYAAQSGQPVPAHLQQHLPGGGLSGSGSNKPEPVKAAPVKTEPKPQPKAAAAPKSIAASPSSYAGYTSSAPTKTSDSGPKKGAAGRATGGLVTRGTKTAHKTKGLAGKQ